MTSCIQSKKIAYFNDSLVNDSIVAINGLEPVIQVNDMLSINVSSLSPEATLIFNAPNFPVTPASNPGVTLQQTAGYIVDQQGCIQFPILGKIQAAGLLKSQLETSIASELTKRDQLSEPMVKIRYLNFRVTVLGEVARPGVVTVPGEQISILEALGASGDLTIYGKRDNVMLIRQEGNQKIVHRINLNSANIMQSPYFYMRSNDVLYVEPVKARVAASSRSQQLLPSILAGISIVVVLITSLVN
ncbi:polysaccharide biosynthesis/export family protein [Flavihumibacter solisilvae]|nr:polysaccharide biosynthesis/export family protein [Flavihumibacter solisilvae]